MPDAQIAGGVALTLVSVFATAMCSLIQNSKRARPILITIAALSGAAAIFILLGPWLASHRNPSNWPWITAHSVQIAQGTIAASLFAVAAFLILRSQPVCNFIGRTKRQPPQTVDVFDQELAVALAKELGPRQALREVKEELSRRPSKSGDMEGHGHSGDPRSRELLRIAEESCGSVLPVVKELEKYDLVRLARKLDEQSISGLVRKLRDGDLG